VYGIEAGRLLGTERKRRNPRSCTPLATGQ
jgi:hypothetical protein